MTKDLAKTDTIRSLLSSENVREQFRSALPKHITPERFLRVALTTIMQSEKLMDCDRTSLMKALVQCAQLGIEPDGLLGHAYLIPYHNNQKGIIEAQFQIGYRGLIELARRSGKVQSFSAQVVYENDHFDFAFGINARLEHIPCDGERGKMKAAYAIVTYKDGGHDFDVMFRADIEKVKQASKAKDSGPWKTYEAEMWRKSVAKKLAKYLSLSVEFQRAANLDEYNDMGLSELPMGPSNKEIEARFDDVETTPEPPKTEKAPAKKAKAVKKAAETPPEPSETVGECTEDHMTCGFMYVAGQGIGCGKENGEHYQKECPFKKG